MIEVLKNKIKEYNRFGNLCFFIACVDRSEARDLVYWSVSSVLNDEKGRWVASVLEDYEVMNWDLDRNIIFDYEYEHVLLKNSGAKIAARLKCGYSNNRFDVKKIGNEELAVLPDTLPPLIVDEGFFDDLNDESGSAAEALQDFLQAVQNWIEDDKTDDEDEKEEKWTKANA